MLAVTYILTSHLAIGQALAAAALDLSVVIIQEMLFQEREMVEIIGLVITAALLVIVLVMMACQEETAAAAVVAMIAVLPLKVGLVAQGVLAAVEAEVEQGLKMQVLAEQAVTLAAGAVDPTMGTSVEPAACLAGAVLVEPLSTHPILLTEEWEVQEVLAEAEAAVVEQLRHQGFLLDKEEWEVLEVVMAIQAV